MRRFSEFLDYRVQFRKMTKRDWGCLGKAFLIVAAAMLAFYLIGSAMLG